jgi:hypothetical protein
MVPFSGRLRWYWCLSDEREALPSGDDFDFERLRLRPPPDELPPLLELELDFLLELREFRCVATPPPPFEKSPPHKDCSARARDQTPTTRIPPSQAPG